MILLPIFLGQLGQLAMGSLPFCPKPPDFFGKLSIFLSFLGIVSSHLHFMPNSSNIAVFFIFFLYFSPGLCLNNIVFTISQRRNLIRFTNTFYPGKLYWKNKSNFSENNSNLARKDILSAPVTEPISSGITVIIILSHISPRTKEF